MNKENTKPEIVRCIYDTYIAVIKNSVGSNLFRNLYVKMDGKQVDVMKNGDLSCAFFVSSILTLFKFIKEVHGTVDSTVKDLKESGWTSIEKPEIGSIIVWEKVDFGKNDIHKHIGFFIGNNMAISNDSKAGTPVMHDWTFDGKRKVESILWKSSIVLEK